MPKSFRRNVAPKAKKNIRDTLKNMRKARPELRSIARREDTENNRAEHKQSISFQSKICTRSQNGVGQPQKISYDEWYNKERCSNSQPRPFEKGVSEKKRIAGA